MLAEFTLLLHETTDTLRRESPREVLVWISGVASPGKSRLISALQDRLAPLGVRLHSSDGPPSPAGSVRRTAIVHVHAETDLEALLEPHLLAGSRAAAGVAELQIPVDWEGVERSVARVYERLLTRGILAASVGGL